MPLDGCHLGICYPGNHHWPLRGLALSMLLTSWQISYQTPCKILRGYSSIKAPMPAHSKTYACLICSHYDNTHLPLPQSTNAYFPFVHPPCSTFCIFNPSVLEQGPRVCFIWATLKEKATELLNQSCCVLDRKTSLLPYIRSIRPWLIVMYSYAHKCINPHQAF